MNHLACWQDLPWAVLDFETTGFHHYYDAIVEVAIVRMHHGRILDRWSSLINPMRLIPRDAQDLHGIGDADVHRAPTFLDALPTILHHLRDAVPVAYQASFDSRMLRSAAEKAGLVDLPERALDLSWPWADPLHWVRHLDRFDKKATSNKLPVACARWGVPLDKSHRALHDAEATGALLWKMAPFIGRMTLTELLRRQLLKRDNGRRNENPPAA